MKVLNLVDSIFILLGLCFLIEQVFYWVKGSYPYRYGFVVRRISLSGLDIKYWDSIKSKIKGLDTKTSWDKAEVYLKYKYPPLMMGPLLFIGQIKGVDSQGVLYIRVGPLSAMFVLFLFIYPFLSSEFFVEPMSKIMDILILVVIMAYLYFKLLNPINRIILDREEEGGQA